MHIIKPKKPVGEVLCESSCRSSGEGAVVAGKGVSGGCGWAGELRAILGSEMTLSGAVTSVLKHVFEPRTSSTGGEPDAHPRLRVVIMNPCAHVRCRSCTQRARSTEGGRGGLAGSTCEFCAFCQTFP